MYTPIRLLRVFALVGAILFAPSAAYAQSVLLPTPASAGTYPVQTLEYLQDYYGIYPVEYRSQRGREHQNSVPDYLTQDYYTHPEMFSSERMTQFDENFLEMFERVAVETEHTIYDNNSIGDAQIDLRSIVSHNCFHPVHGEIDACIEQFGPYYNLKNAILDGTLRNRLIERNPDIAQDINALYEAMVTEIRNTDVQKPVSLGYYSQNSTAISPSMSDTEDETTVFDQSYFERVDLRSAFVWEVCMSKYPLWKDAARCYARNDHLVLNPDRGLLIDASSIEDMIR